MAKLPTNAVLKKLFLQGLTDDELAAQYGTTRQGVNKRRVALGMGKKPEAANLANDLIPWNVKTLQYGSGTHHTAYALEGLKLFLRSRMGDDTLSKRQAADAERFRRRLLKNPGLVLDYDRDSEKGFKWVERRPQDDDLILRWPGDAEKPPVEELDLLRMPQPPDESDGEAPA